MGKNFNKKSISTDFLVRISIVVYTLCFILLIGLRLYTPGKSLRLIFFFLLCCSTSTAVVSWVKWRSDINVNKMRESTLSKFCLISFLNDPLSVAIKHKNLLYAVFLLFMSFIFMIGILEG